MAIVGKYVEYLNISTGVVANCISQIGAGRPGAIQQCVQVWFYFESFFGRKLPWIWFWILLQTKPLDSVLYPLADKSSATSHNAQTPLLLYRLIPQDALGAGSDCQDCVCWVSNKLSLIIWMDFGNKNLLRWWVTWGSTARLKRHRTTGLHQLVLKSPLSGAAIICHSCLDKVTSCQSWLHLAPPGFTGLHWASLGSIWLHWAPQVAKSCQKLSQVVKSWHKLTKVAKICHKLP